jgi:MFS family permease
VILPLTALFGLILLSSKALVGSIWYFYLFYTALGVTGSASGPVAYGLVVSHWFNRRRGLALGLMLFGIGLGAIIIPSVAQQLIAMSGWRAAYATFGVAVLLIPLPVVGIFLRDDPAQEGLLPDGDLQPQNLEKEERTDYGLSWHDIWRTPTFWLMISSFFLVGASVHACVIHIPALLTDRGISAQGAAMASSVLGVALLIGRVVSGCLLDRFFAARVALFFFGGAAVGIALLLAGSAGKIALLAAFLVGLGMGAEGDIIAFLTSRYFGLRAMGIAYGFGFGAYVLAGAVGAFVMGASFDLTGSYSLPLAASFIAMLSAAALMTRLGPYRYSTPQADERRPLVSVQMGSHA